jgi:DNA modification methylase
MDLSFDLELTGFATSEIDNIIRSEEPEENDDADKLPDLGLPLVTKSGDVWDLGKHRLICGNSLEAANYKALLNGETADAIFSDPPYNCPVSGHICGNGKIQHDEFAMASGEMSDDEFLIFLAAVIALMIEFSKNGSLHYICIDWRGIHQLISAGQGQYHELKNICIWNKSNAGLGSLYRSKHEFVPVFKNGSAPHTNNILLGMHGRYRSNVWDYPGVNSFGRTDDLKMHPTVKPVAMVADAILDCTKRGEIVLDPFAGSGSTLIACEEVGRVTRCIELEPKYCDVIMRRWQAFTGQDAVHADSGKTFNEIQNTGSIDHE